MSLTLFASELVLIAGSLMVFAISLATGRDRLAAQVATLVALVNVGVCAVTLPAHGFLFANAYRVDLFSQLLKLFVAISLAAVVLFGGRMKGVSRSIQPEYYLFLMLGSLGLDTLVSSVELISLFIALELASGALYLLVPLRREQPGLRVQMESAAKYVMFGIVATAFLVFGMSYLYGLSGSTYFGDIAPALAKRWSEPAAIAGLLLVVAGLLFKLAAFPMHMWAPDVYQGASNETTAFIAVAPKIAAVAVLTRFLLCARPSGEVISLVLTLVAVGSMFFGNLAALVQKDVKRMLGYSSIAHAGYLMLGLVTLQVTGCAAAIFYIFGFTAMSLSAFLVICQVSHDGENVTVSDLSGLHRRNPLAALILAASMFALAGIPPFVGFIGKFLLFSEALRGGFLMLAAVAAINTAIGIYYYLTVVGVIYFGEVGERPEVKLDRLAVVTGVALIVLVTALGIMPGRLMEATVEAVRATTIF